MSGESLVVSSWTTLSRITGLGKLAVIAAFLGPTYMGNAFQAMNLLPMVAYEFLTGSLLVNLLVPHLVKQLRPGDPSNVQRVAGGFLGRAIVGFTALIAVLFAARPFILDLFTVGVADPAVAAAQRNASSILLALMLPQILLYAIAGVAGSVLNAKGRFGLVAAAPVFENLAIIGTVVVAAVLYGDAIGSLDAPVTALILLGAGATTAVALHAAALWLGCLRSGVVLRPRIARGDADVAALIAGIPATIGQAGLNALRTVAALVVANAVAGGVVAFQFAMALFYLPAALGAKAVGVPMLRRLSAAHARRDDDQFRHTFTEGVALTAFLAIPAAFIYLTFAVPIVRAATFGEMATRTAVGLVAVALTALAVGVVGEASFLLGSYASYARHDPRSPLQAMLVRTVITVGGMAVAAVSTSGRTLIVCLAIAVTVGNMVASTYLSIRQRRWLNIRTKLAPSVARTVIASLAMVATTLPAWTFLRSGDDAAGEVLSTMATLSIAALTYLATHTLMRSPELRSLVNGLRRTPSGPMVLQAEGRQVVEVEPGGWAVRKTYDGPSAETRANHEYARLAAVFAALTGQTDVTSPRPLGIDITPVPTVRMTRLDGEPLDVYLRRTDIDGERSAWLVRALRLAVLTYIDATGEAYHDFHLRNTLYDASSGRIGIVDFDVPADAVGDTGVAASALERSLGNLVGSAIFETTRPRAIASSRFRRQSVAVCAAFLDSFEDGDRRIDRGRVLDIADRTYDRCVRRGSWYRRAWYATLGASVARKGRRAVAKPVTRLAARPIETLPLDARIELGPSTSRLPVLPQRTVFKLGVVLGVVLIPAAALYPIATMLAVGAISLGTAIALYPAVAAYLLVFTTPLVVGLNRSSVIPVLRANEALLLLAAAALLIRYTVVSAVDGRPIRLHVGRFDSAIAALVLTGSVLPLLWMVARNRTITREDFLYALVMWKLAATYFVVRASVRTEKQVRLCLWVSMAAVSIVALIGIAQAIGVPGVGRFLSRYYAPEGLTAIVTNNRATSTIANSIALADVMAIHAAVAAAFLLRGIRRHRGLLFAAAGLFSVGALASGQLSGLVALGIALGVVGLLTGQSRKLVVAAIPLALVALFALQPVVAQRLRKVDPVTGMPQSWVARKDNLTTYFLPELTRGPQAALGVRTAGRVPAHEGWRDWVYIESGYVWLLWTGGIPFLLAFFLYLRRGLRVTTRTGRLRRDGVGVAAIAGASSLALVAVLMTLDPHLTMRGTADVSFALLALATARVGMSPRSVVLQR